MQYWRLPFSGKEKGCTGSNYHSGKYKSTGMGLYMADKIAKKPEHEMSVESRYGECTCFCIVFRGKLGIERKL